MNALRFALATAAFLAMTGGAAAADGFLHVQYRTAQPVERDASAADREPKGKERTPPPRPIVPPAGQQENPALREECAWIGQRIISLLFRDDPMTGHDFVPFYTRFGCPEEHLGRSFACVVSAGSLENDALADRIALCWTDPSQRPSTISGNSPDGKGEAPAAAPVAPSAPAPSPAGPPESTPAKPITPPAPAPGRPAEPASK